MSIINPTYFVKGELYLGQIGSQEVQSKVTTAIQMREPEYLRLILGPVVYDQLIAAIDAAGTDPLPEPWYSLMNGATFLAPWGHGSMEQLYWTGLAKPAEPWHSPIAMYVYYFYNKSEATKLVGAGAAVPILENAVRVNVNPLQRAQWNRMVEKNMLLFAYMRANMDQFPDWPYYSNGWGHPELRRIYRDHCYNRPITPLQNLFMKINDFNL